jgi:hypothetical protein
MSHVEPVDERTRSRRRRTTITLIVTVLGLFFAFWYAYSYYRADLSSASSDSTTTATPCATYIPPTKITLNVYNSTNRTGLAARTAKSLRQQGFRINAVANDPLDRSITGVAQIRFGKSGAARSKTVQAVVPGAKRVRDKRKDNRVDLVLGRKFSSLAPSSVLSECPGS